MSNVGIKVGQYAFSDLDYADDAALLNADTRKWEDVLRRFEIEANTLGLHTSWTKTETQNIAHGECSSTISINGHDEEPVTSFMYLGSTISSSGYLSPTSCAALVSHHLVWGSWTECGETEISRWHQSSESTVHAYSLCCFMVQKHGRY